MQQQRRGTRRASRGLTRLGVSCLCLALAACSSNKNGKPSSKPDVGHDAGTNSGSTGFGGSDNPALIDASNIAPGTDAGLMATTLVLSPNIATITLDSTDPKPVAFSALLSNGAASAVAVRWSSDHRELGSIDAVTGVFKPTGVAGVVTITALAGSLTTSVTIDIVVKAKQEGDPDSGNMPAGAGGLGGVGGEGGGSKIADAALREALDKPATDDAELTWLYPYDGTVWPRGLPAPLLQWRHGAHAPLAVKLRIEVEPSFSIDLYLGPPPGLPADKPVDRVPIPQAIWRTALQSGRVMKVSLTIAASDGAGGYAAYTATKNPTWSVAPTTLKGVVYYNSYGTKLAENYGPAKGGNGRFGGATLAIQRDAFDPTLIAGSTTKDGTGCRVCHVVSANGSVMIVQHENNVISSAYDLKNMNRETVYPSTDNGKFGWAALSADGTLALGNSGPPSNAVNRASLDASGLYKVSDGTVLTAQGLASFVTQAATPTFSLDTTKVAFNLLSGPGTSSIMADGRSLVVMDLKRIDDKTYDFSNPKAVFTASTTNQMPGWPFFLPDGNGIVFQLELKPGDGNTHLLTSGHARGELWWTDLQGSAHALERANGKGSLPTGQLGHDDDPTLNYEPTVAPIVAGGYAWVVFTSRRLYGNVATRDPFESDPRQFDLRSTNAAGPTTKKLWVTALDVPAKSGTDPSHPAFYMPAQELYAGNARGYWVLDACKENTASCATGDECCGGFCRVTEEFNIGVCMDVPPQTCSKEYDRCNVNSDCCADGKTQLYCIAGHCAMINLQ
jgi:hypothetical protein